MQTASNRSVPAALVLLFLCILPRSASAQVAPDGEATPNDSTVVSVRLSGGGELRGRVLSEGDPLVLLLLSGDTLSVARERVVSVEELDGTVVDGDYWPNDPNRTSLFVGPTARTLRQGDGYMASYELFFPLVGFGVTDHVTLAGGFPLIGEILDEGVFYLAPKLRAPGLGPRVDLAVGGLIFVAPGEGTAGVVYAVTTLGSRDASVTLGVLDAWIGDRLGDAFVLAAGDIRVARNAKIVSENYFSGEEGFLMGGVRFFAERMSGDLGIAVTTGGSGGDLLPIVNFMFSW